MSEAVVYARAIVLRADGASWAEISAELGYTSRSGAEHAVQAGLDGSWLVVGLRVVMFKRMERLETRLRNLEPMIPPRERVAYRAALDHVEHMKRLLYDAPGAGPWVACVADVVGLVARRRPHLPAVDEQQRGERLRSRLSNATLDEMRGGYANRSGVQKALERDVRRLLLEAAAQYFDDELMDIRYCWREIDEAVRRRPVDVAWLGDMLGRLDNVLDGMHVFDVLLTYGHLVGSRS